MAKTLSRRILGAALAAAMGAVALGPALADDSRVNRSRGGGDDTIYDGPPSGRHIYRGGSTRINASTYEHERDQPKLQAWERQRKLEEYEASQGGRSGPNAIGPEPFKNPRSDMKPPPGYTPPRSR